MYMNLVTMRLTDTPGRKGTYPDDMFKFFPDQPNAVTIRSPDDSKEEHEYMFDKIFGVDAVQDQIFEEIGRPLCEHVLNGFNSCCFAYGQTGAGKTYTIFGEGGDKRGLIPRSMECIFESLDRKTPFKKIALFCSFLEIYLDNVRDLGDAYLEQQGYATKKMVQPWEREGQGKKGVISRPPSGRSSRGGSSVSDSNEYVSLDIREKPDGTVFVKDLSNIQVSTIEEVFDIMEAGFSKRATYETNMNPVSSRSHSVFTLTVVQTDRNDPDDVVTGMFNLVDLAGSERLAKSGSEGVRLREAALINKSLSALGNTVMALDSGDPTRFIPYRDSKLTRVLQDSLGGNSYTTLLAAVNPLLPHYEETLSTLQFANRCRAIENLPRVNYMETGAAGQEKRIKKLQAEVADLQAELASTHGMYQKRISQLSNVLGIRPDAHEDILRGAVPVSDVGKVLETAKKENKVLQDRLERKKNDFMMVQMKVKDAQEKYIEESRGYKHHINDLVNNLEVAKQDMVNAINTQIRSHEEELSEVVTNNQRLLNEQNALVSNIPDVLRIRSEMIREKRDLREIGYTEAERQFKKTLKDWDTSKKEEIELLTVKFRQVVEKKEEEIQLLKDELRKFKDESESQKSILTREIYYLYEYIRRLTTIIENCEKGNYAIYDKAGIKGFVIPNTHKPGFLDFNVCNHVQKLIVRADRYIHRQGQLVLNVPEPSPDSDFEDYGAEAASRQAELRDTQGYVEQSVAVSDINMMNEDQLRAELLALRAIVGHHGQETMTAGQSQLGTGTGRDDDLASISSSVHQVTLARNQMEEQVMNDLVEHSAVEYMRQLEDDRDRYRKLLAEEVQRRKNLKVALDAKSRLLSKMEENAASMQQPMRSTSQMAGGLPKSSSRDNLPGRTSQSSRNKGTVAQNAPQIVRPGQAKPVGRPSTAL